MRRGTGFSYVAVDGSVVGPEERARIAGIAIPPAWTDVWICPNPDGHILATGRDARGRKQYRYHPRWREVRDGNKYDRLGRFGHALPGIRSRLEEDLSRRGLGEEKVLATVVSLLDESLIRIHVLGNTRAVARSCYVHPGITDAYREGALDDAWRRARGRPRFSRPEAAVLTVIEASDRSLPAGGDDDTCQAVP